jgi:serine/threonine protein phosphatase PrpC
METRNEARSDTGMVREHNEDALLVYDPIGLYGVADGMGGHAAGEVASKLALDAVAQTVGKLLAHGERDPKTVLHAAARAAITKVFQESEANPELHGMGTTLTLLWIRPDGAAAMAHVGDSRLYRMRDGRVKQLSCDHTFAEELAQAGVADRATLRKGDWGHALTKSVGQDPEVEPDVQTIEVRPGDRFLLCTDGLTDHVETETDLKVDLQANLADAAQSLIDFANASGGHDNVTVVVVEVIDEEDGLKTGSDHLLADSTLTLETK